MLRHLRMTFPLLSDDNQATLAAIAATLLRFAVTH